MSIGDVQARIGQIQTLMLATAGAAPVTSATRAASASTGVTGVTKAAGTEFAAALAAAVAANKPAAAGGPDAASRPTAAKEPKAVSTVPAGGWVLPAKGNVSSEFGHRWGTQHQGIDIAAASGSPVRAATDGVVKKASWYGGYGNAVIIDHGDGIRTLYGHNSKLKVKPGDRVQAGEVIAKVGSTGDSTGPHLHFEVEIDGKKVNPRPFMRKHGAAF